MNLISTSVRSRALTTNLKVKENCLGLALERIHLKASFLRLQLPTQLLKSLTASSNTPANKPFSGTYIFEVISE